MLEIGGTSGQGLGLLDLDVDDSLVFDEAEAGDEVVGVDVGERGVEADVAVGVVAGLVAEAGAVGAVDEPAPPRVDRIQTLTFDF